jgi:hypothetical protein
MNIKKRLEAWEFKTNVEDVPIVVEVGGSKHLLGLWPGATENSEVCG